MRSRIQFVVGVMDVIDRILIAASTNSL